MMWGQLMNVIEKSGKEENSGKKRGKRKQTFFSWKGVKYVVGALVAELLGRETFNLYGSLRRRDIALWPADHELLSFLCIRGCIFAGSTSATLLKVDDISVFVFLTLEENMRRKMRRTAKTQPKRTKAPNEADHVAILRNLKHVCVTVGVKIQQPHPPSFLQQAPLPPSFVFQGDQFEVED
jgi:hypothetical protein